MKNVTLFEWIMGTFLVCIVIAELVRASPNKSVQPQTPEQVYEECINQTTNHDGIFPESEVQAEISACLQISQLASSTNL